MAVAPIAKGDRSAAAIARLHNELSRKTCIVLEPNMNAVWRRVHQLSDGRLVAVRRLLVDACREAVIVMIDGLGQSGSVDGRDLLADMVGGA